MWKAILLTVGAYVLTLIVASLAAAILLSVLAPRGCNAMSQALLVLWVTIAALFLASGIAVSVAAWKRLSHTAGTIVLVAVYALVLLTSYLVIAFGLMVAFNC